MILVPLVSAWLLTLFLSPSTPLPLSYSLAEDLKEALSPWSVVVEALGSTLQTDWMPEPADLWIDATYSALLSEALRDLARELRVMRLALIPGEFCETTVHLSTADLAKELGEVIRRFEWEGVTLIASLKGDELGAALQAEGIETRVYKVTPDYSAEMSLALLTKEIKVWSSPVILCAADPEACSSLLQAAQQANMMKTGYAYILTHPPGMLQMPAVPGLLHVLEKGTEAAQTLSKYHAMRVAYWVGRLAEAENALALTQAPDQDLRSARAWNWLGSDLKPLESLPTFPGNTTAVPLVRKPSVSLSIDGDFSNPTQPPNTPYEDHMLAATLAFSEMPAFIPSHDLIWHNVTYGCTEFLEPYVRKQLLAYRNQLGVAHMGPIGSAVAIGAMRILEEWKIELPIIGSTNAVVALSNSTRYPFFVRTVVSNNYGATVYLTLFRYFGWKKVNILYGNETYGIDFYNHAKAIAKEYGIELANREDLRAIDPYVTNATIGKYTTHLQEILDNNVRPLLFGLLMPAPAYVLQALYNLGAREGDIIYFGQLSFHMLHTFPSVNASKVIELALGGIHLTSEAFVGAKGKAVFKSFQRKFGFDPQAESCFYYDSAYALAHALQLLIHQGKDYEDPRVFMQGLRKTQFRGCSGIVAFESGSNDRSFPGYVVINLQGSPGDLKLVNTGRYTPTAIKLFNYEKPIIWPGGGFDIPSNLVTSTLNCPFKDRYVHEFGSGQVLFGVVCGFIIVLFAIFNLITYALFWRIECAKLSKRESL